MLKWCRNCMKLVAAKKEKQGKGKKAVYYCPHCGKDI